MTTIKIKRGTGAPTSGDLDTAEMGLDTSAGVVYISTDGTDVVKVGEVTLDGSQTLTNKTLTSPTINTGIAGTAVLDDDTFATASATTIATSESIKAYVDTEIAGISVSIDGITSTATSEKFILTDSVSTFNTDLRVNGLTLGRGLNNDSASVAFGDNALASTTTGGNNTAIGEYALTNVTTGLGNTAIGTYSGLSIIGGSFNVSVGGNSYGSGTASYNTAIGYNSMSGSVTGNGNTGCGYNTLNDISSGVGNGAFGTEALPKLTTGSYNVAVGSNAGNDLTTANDNVLIGYFAGQNLTTSVQNVAIGTQALNTSINAYGENTCVGYKSLYSCTAGQGNTAMGWSALDDLTTGVGNTGFGFNCGIGLTTGGNNSFLGFEATPSSATVSNEITLGNSSVLFLRCNASLSGLSDIRDKTNIADLTGCSAFVKEIEPVSFDWNRRDGSMQGMSSHGFIAQQLKAAQESTGHHIPGLVHENNPEKLEVAAAELLPTVVAALKEALTEIDELKAKVAALESA